MKKIKVAFFAEVLIRDFDGSTRTIAEITDRIDRNRFEFLFFCGVPPVGSFAFEVFHVPVMTIPFNKDYKMASMFLMGPRVEERLDRFAPDLIHISTPSPLGYFALKYGLRKSLPVTSIYHTDFISYIKYYTNNTPLVTSALESMVIMHNKNFYNRCTRVFAPTRAMIDDLSDRDFAVDNMVIWPRGIKMDLFNPSKANKKYIKAVAQNDHLNLLFVSRLVWEKNLEVLIDMYDEIERQALPYNLIIAGSGVAKEEMMRRMPKAIFLGHRSHEELSILYASSDYFVFTSVTETFGNVITEAMASGTPCLIADGGGSRSLIKQGINGFLCKPNNAKDYLHKVDLLEKHPTFKKMLIQQALEDVSGMSWSRLVSSLFDQMERLALPYSQSRQHDYLPMSETSQPL
jgi:glycosyltransferase involved in cell wall biosynthesis